MNNLVTVHSSRTIMFNELEKVMDFAQGNANYEEALKTNVTGKRSNTSIKKTANFLKTLYRFDIKDPFFLAFQYFWDQSTATQKPILAFLFAVNRDYLLSESRDVIRQTETGKKVVIASLEENIEKYHPGKYSQVTKHSIAKNIASSWKQAGFIQGKVKNIRVQPEIDPATACFAFLLAYLSGKSGDFIWSAPVVRALCLSENILRELAGECARKDLIQYQYAGNVTVISFDNLLKRIGINAIED